MPISFLFRWRTRPETRAGRGAPSRRAGGRALLALLLAVALYVGSAGPATATSAAGTGLTWSSLSPPVRPPGLVGAVAAYDRADSTIVLFGGRLANGQLSDRTWVWNGSTWADPTIYGSSPVARQLASMTFDSDLDPPQLVLFGGRGADGALLGDTWTWNGSSWNQVPTTSSPGAREGAVMTTDGDNHLVLFGGYGITMPSSPAAPPTTTPLSTTTTTTMAPSTTTTTTTTVPAVTTTTVPTGNTPAAPPAASDTALLTGGGATTDSSTAPSAVTVPEVLDDTWVLAQSATGADAWQRVTTRIHPPPTTDAALAAGPSGSSVLFGGTASEPGDDQSGGASAQTWTWNGRTWSRPVTRSAPGARQDATLAFDTDIDATVLYGGLGRAVARSDTWLWNGVTWRQVAPATAPAARSGAASAYDPASRQLVAFGGLGAGGATLSSTEVLGARSPTKATTSPVSTSTTTSPASTSPTTVRGGRTTTTGAHPTSTGGTSSSPGSAGTVDRPSILEHRGDIVTLSGSGFLPHAVITITFHSVTVAVGTKVADAEGSFRISVAVPMQAAIGDHHFEASGMGPDGLTDLITPIRVVALGGSHHTSTSTKVTLIAIALAIPALSWVILGVLGRRRRRTALV